MRYLINVSDNIYGNWVYSNGLEANMTGLCVLYNIHIMSIYESCYTRINQRGCKTVNNVILMLYFKRVIVNVNVNVNVNLTYADFQSASRWRRWHSACINVGVCMCACHHRAQQDEAHGTVAYISAW